MAVVHVLIPSHFALLCLGVNTVSKSRCVKLAVPGCYFCSDTECYPHERSFSLLSNTSVTVVDLKTALDHSEDITHIVSVCTLEAHEAKVLRQVKHRVIPVLDEPEQDILSHLTNTVSWLCKALYTPKTKILIHCHMGISRSVTVACALVMRVYGFSPSEAYLHVRRRNRYARPNVGFCRQLCSYHRILEYSKLVRYLKDVTLQVGMTASEISTYNKARCYVNRIIIDYLCPTGMVIY